VQNIFGDPSLDLLLLRPQTDQLHADALNRLNGLIGFESTVFMVKIHSELINIEKVLELQTIYTNDALFNEFIDLFCRHCIRSTATAHEAMESSKQFF
jgi:hypothetical protein